MYGAPLQVSSTSADPHSLQQNPSVIPAWSLHVCLHIGKERSNCRLPSLVQADHRGLKSQSQREPCHIQALPSVGETTQLSSEINSALVQSNED